MKKFLLVLIVLVLGLTQDVFSQDGLKKGWYYVKSIGFYKPMLADIRANQLHMRAYRDSAIVFSKSTKPGKHTFWDVGFSGEFPLLGYKQNGEESQGWLESTGLEFFVEGSAHMLLDFNAQSSDVINTDFRFGAGVSSRLPFGSFWKNITLRAKYFHESTHIGDEFTLGAVTDTLFSRYNVSYQAAELFLAYDRSFSSSSNRLISSYFRMYSGYRYIGDGIFLNKEPQFDDYKVKGFAKALKLDSRYEIQLGAEVFLKAWALPTDSKRLSESTFSKIMKPQYWVIAMDFYRRDKYDVIEPRKVWSTNLVVGFIYGDYFRGERTVKWLMSFYRGVNPHGQFRSTEIDYNFAIDYIISF